MGEIVDVYFTVFSQIVEQNLDLIFWYLFLNECQQIVEFCLVEGLFMFWQQFIEVDVVGVDEDPQVG